MSDTQILPKPGIFRTVLLSRSLTIGTLITVILVAMALVATAAHRAFPDLLGRAPAERPADDPQVSTPL